MKLHVAVGLGFVGRVEPRMCCVEDGNRASDSTRVESKAVLLEMLSTVIGKVFISTSRHDLIPPFLKFENGESRMNVERLTIVVNQPAMTLSMIVVTNVVRAVKECVTKVVREIDE